MDGGGRPSRFSGGRVARYSRVLRRARRKCENGLGGGSGHASLHAIRAFTRVSIARAKFAHEPFCLGTSETFCGIRGLPVRRACALVLVLHALAIAAELALTRMNPGALTGRDYFHEKRHVAIVAERRS